MRQLTDFHLELRLLSRRKYHVWYYKAGENPVALEVMDHRADPATI